MFLFEAREAFRVCNTLKSRVLLFLSFFFQFCLYFWSAIGQDRTSYISGLLLVKIEQAENESDCFCEFSCLL